jgi:hypothetical protein
MMIFVMNFKRVILDFNFLNWELLTQRWAFAMNILGTILQLCRGRFVKKQINPILFNILVPSTIVEKKKWRTETKEDKAVPVGLKPIWPPEVLIEELREVAPSGFT